MAWSNEGDLTEELEKDGRKIVRKLSLDREYLDVMGNPLTLKGRSLMLVRNVGHLMTTDAVIDENGSEVPEGFGWVCDFFGSNA